MVKVKKTELGFLYPSLSRLTLYCKETESNLGYLQWDEHSVQKFRHKNLHEKSKHMITETHLWPAPGRAWFSPGRLGRVVWRGTINLISISWGYINCIVKWTMASAVKQVYQCSYGKPYRDADPCGSSTSMKHVISCEYSIFRMSWINVFRFWFWISIWICLFACVLRGEGRTHPRPISK